MYIYIYSGIETHNLIRQGDRYHWPIRRILNIMSETQTELAGEIWSFISTKAINDTMGPNERLHPQLVFGVLPSLPISMYNNPTEHKD